MPDPILFLLRQVRDLYVIQLDNVDLIFEKDRLKELQAAITELDQQIANQEKGGE